MLTTGAAGRAAVPSGASTGQFEAVELRDGGDRYGGKGVADAVAPRQRRASPRRSSGSTRSTSARSTSSCSTLDGTDNKGSLGANAILGVSLAVARAAAEEVGLPLYRYVGGANAHVLPVPMMNVLNGGEHADNNVDIQEFMIMPVGAASFSEALRWGTETYHVLKKVLPRPGPVDGHRRRGRLRPEPRLQRGGRAAAGRRPSSRPATRPASRSPSPSTPASSEFYARRQLRPRRRGAHARRPTEFADYLGDLCARYPIVSIEDGMAEEDWDGWAALTAADRRDRSSSSATTCS